MRAPGAGANWDHGGGAGQSGRAAAAAAAAFGAEARAPRPQGRALGRVQVREPLHSGTPRCRPRARVGGSGAGSRAGCAAEGARRRGRGRSPEETLAALETLAARARGGLDSHRRSRACGRHSELSRQRPACTPSARTVAGPGPRALPPCADLDRDGRDDPLGAWEMQTPGRRLGIRLSLL